MELFDKLGDTIVSVSKDATQKAKDISELARIRMELRNKQDYLNKLFLEIGKLYYDAHKEDEEKEFKEQMLLVKDAQEVIEELKQQLGQIKGTVQCTGCGQIMPLEADYCSKCGMKLVKPKKEEDTEDIFEEGDEAVEADVVESAADVQAESDAASDTEVKAEETAEVPQEGESAAVSEEKSEEIY